MTKVPEILLHGAPDQELIVDKQYPQAPAMPYPSRNGPVDTGCPRLLSSSIRARQRRVRLQPDGIIEQMRTTHNFEETAHQGKRIPVKFYVLFREKSYMRKLIASFTAALRRTSICLLLYYKDCQD
jgi:hypothetical protein